jgi:hypothetical protein
MIKSTIYFPICFLIVFSACKNNDDFETTNSVFRIANYALDNLETSNKYSSADTMGILGNNLIDEASGIAVSRSNPNFIWTHNDSGDPNRLFLVDANNAEDYGFFWIRNSGNRDWEDMCIGPGPQAGFNYIYIGDIGDNNGIHESIYIYRFIEPDLSSHINTGSHEVQADLVDRFQVQYPDGPRDAETLMIDPITKDLFIVTKRDFRSTVYRLPYPPVLNDINVLEKRVQLPFNFATAGDISADGRHIVIKTERFIYMWERQPNESVDDALMRQPKYLPYLVEPKGEAFTWDHITGDYLTLSEIKGGSKPVLYRYRKL